MCSCLYPHPGPTADRAERVKLKGSHPPSWNYSSTHQRRTPKTLPIQWAPKDADATMALLGVWVMRITRKNNNNNQEKLHTLFLC